MMILRMIAALPFMFIGNIFFIIAVLVIALASKIEGVDRLLRLFEEIGKSVEDHEVIS